MDRVVDEAVTAVGIVFLVALFATLAIFLVIGQEAAASPPPPPPHPCWVPPSEQLEIKGQRPDNNAHTRRVDIV